MSLMALCRCFMVALGTVFAICDDKIALRKLCSPQDIVQANYKPPTSLHRLKNNEYSNYKFFGTSAITEVNPRDISNGGIVTVHFTSTSPQDTDWIGAYIAQPNGDDLAFAPIKYACCASDDRYLSTGRGSLRFSFVTLRDQVTFHFFKNATAYPVLANSAPWNVSLGSKIDPLRPRVVASGHNSYSVLWSSGYVSRPSLRCRTSSNSETIIPASSTNLGSTVPPLLCGPPATTTAYHDLGYQYSAPFPIVPFGDVIWYSFGDAATNTYSKEYIFVPPVPRGVSNSRVLIVDDIGRGSSDDDAYLWAERETAAASTSAAITAAINDYKQLRVTRNSDLNISPFSGIVIGGDISYASGHLASWEFFLDLFSDVFSSMLVMTLVGNHESASLYSKSDSGGECGVINSLLLPMPAPATTNKPWYLPAMFSSTTTYIYRWSKDIGLLHMISMSTEHNFSLGSEQYDWLVADLESVNRQVTPHIIFGGHRPMYAYAPITKNTPLDDEVSIALRLNIEPLFAKFAVTFAYWGHKHSYQRLSAIRLGTAHPSATIYSADNEVTVRHTNPRGTVHVVVGSGGAAFAKSASSTTSTSCPEDWCELLLYKHGYGVLTATNSTHLIWEWIENSSREVLDRIIIITTPNTATKNSYGQFADFLINIIVVVAIVILCYAIYQRLCICLSQQYYRYHNYPHPYQEITQEQA